VHRTVGLTLRRTAGGGVIVALGFGALTSPGQELVPVAVSAAASPVRIALPASDQRPHPAARVRLMVFEEATPAPTPAPVKPASSARPVTPRSAAVVAPKPAGGGSAFTYSYCTWWVAHKRPIPWRGNAAEWWWNARAFGFAEGQAPQPGAIMVMGVSGTSPEGHVGYVESVNSNGSFVVSEMNGRGVATGG